MMKDALGWMALDVGGKNETGPGAGGVTDAVVRTLLTLVGETRGDRGVDAVLSRAADRQHGLDLGARWATPDEAVALLQAAVDVTGDDELAVHVGEELLWTGDGGDLAGRLRDLGSAVAALRHVSAVVGRFRPFTGAVALEAHDGRAVVEVAVPPDAPAHPLLCSLTSGLLAEIPALFAPAGARVEERSCTSHGAPACIFELIWVPADRMPERRSAMPAADAPRPWVGPAEGSRGSWAADAPDDGPWEEVAALEAQLAAARSALDHAVSAGARWEAEALSGRRVAGERDRAEAARAALETESVRLRLEVERLERLLAGPATTGPDLLAQDIDGVLDALAARAAEALDGNGTVLVVRPADGSPARVRWHGIAEPEAREIEAALWAGSTPSDLHVAEITGSEVLHGRIGVVCDGDGLPPPDMVRSLARVASLAATTLDLFAALAEARHSDSTARALLSFSDRLSSQTALADAIQLLADVVPDVTGCSQSTVYLWDAERFRLSMAAHTEGVTPPDEDLQVLVPTFASSRSPRSGWGEQTVEADRDPDLPVTVRMDSPDIEQMIRNHQVLVIDQATDDPLLRSMMERTGLPASVVAPMFASGTFVGVVAANFDGTAGSAVIRDPRLHERLSALADRAATGIQNLQLLEQVSHMAWHDSLTGLPNRRLFEDRVEQELVRSKRLGDPVCVFFVDLDRFKDVNDTYGHATGNALIHDVGQRLQACVRDQDTVARLGGDEFAILLPGLSDQLSINQLAERALEAVHSPFDIHGDVVTISASLGIAIAPEHGDTYDDLLNRADKAMFRVKDHGRNGFEVYGDAPGPSHPGRRALDERELYGDLVKAIARNEFFLVFQPTVDLRTTEVVGVEALIRWNHPTLGVLEPGRFVPLAERSDVIVSLDSWVLWQACRQLRAWLDHGLEPLRLSVNVASRDLANPDFFDTVHRTLRDTDIDPSSLELEITQRVVLDPSGPAAENMDRLRRLGVRFVIDDFGTGLSSLDRIGSLPATGVKIDRSFIARIGPDEESSALVGLMVSMAGGLGLTCVAEGVETAAQSAALLRRGCTMAQGHFFSEPLDADAFESMVRTARPAEVPDLYGDPPTDGDPERPA